MEHMSRKENNRVEKMLNELRAKEGMDEAAVAREAKTVYNIAQSQGRICGKMFAGVPLTLIHIDEGYQRTETFSKAKGDQIALNFSNDVYEPIKLNYRDGAYYCPSGQHRIYAHIVMKREFIVAEVISCPREEEIAIFLYQDDNRSKLSPYDRWKAGCELGLPTDIILKEVCEQYGVSIGRLSGKSILGSITTATNIIEKDGREMLLLIFDTVVNSGWHDMSMAWDSRFIRSMHRFYSGRCAKADWKSAQGTLVNFFFSKTPKEVMANALVAYPGDPESALCNLYTDIVKGRRIGGRKHA